MFLRRFNENGLTAFGDWLNQVARDGFGDIPMELLGSNDYSLRLDGDVPAETRTFGTRMEWAAYAYGLLQRVDPKKLDVPFWAWLSLAYFDSVCPKNANGERKVRARARYIPDGDNFRRYYRHLLASPYAIYRAYAEDPAKALCLLATPLHAPGELVEQLAARQELVQNKALVHAASLLYLDPSGAPKRGSGGSGPGSPRRFAEVVDQFDLNFDMFSIAPSAMLALLPKEFDRFKESRPSTGGS